MKFCVVISTAFYFSTVIRSSSCFVAFQTPPHQTKRSRNNGGDRHSGVLTCLRAAVKNTAHTTTATAARELSADEGGKPGTAQMEAPWEELGFQFRPTKSHLRMTYRDGQWGPMELEQVSSPCEFTLKAILV